MAGQSDDELDGIFATGYTREEIAELFGALRDPMRRGARRGVRRILARAPDEADVDDVLFKAFHEVLKVARNGVNRSLEGLGYNVAYKRGMDRARSIIRERNGIKKQAWELHQLNVSAEEESEAAARERLLRFGQECMDVLTPEQRAVIEATVQRQERLSDWVTVRGTSYEAGRRMRSRAIAALRRCVDAKLDADSEDDSDG